MKKLLTLIALLVLAANLSAQDYYSSIKPKRDKVPEWVKVVGMYSASIALDALADASRDEGNKPLSHTLEAASVGVLLASPFVIDYEKDKWGWYAASYITLRIGLFDPIYNTSRGLPVGYTGSTSVYDKTLKGMPYGFKNYMGACSFIVGVAIPINELNR